MKKILCLSMFLYGVFLPVCAENTNIALPVSLPDFDKYTIIKTTHNYTPIRENADVNAKRFSHLKKGVKIFADKIDKDFYRVDLGLDRYYWIEKKYADIDSTAKTKEPLFINELKIYEDSKYYIIKIKTPEIPPYNEIETSTNSLDFIIYDTVIDKENLEQEILTSADFKISKDEFDNLKISYFGKLPLTGHEVVSFEDGLLLKVKKPFKYEKFKPFKKLIIAIDPGHGGNEPGACAFGLKEKDLNLEISKKLEAELKHLGAKVYLTREEDVNKDLYERIDFAKEKEADFLISIHQNSLPDRRNIDKKHGTGVYYYNKEAYNLAKEIKDSLVKETNFKDDGVNLSSLALTRAQNPLCVLVECGYIIHPDESKKLSDSKFQKLTAHAIAVGIKNYLKNNL